MGWLLNKQWNIYISNILGTFWNRVFKDNCIVDWIKRAHYILKDAVWGIAKASVDGASILSDNTSEGELFSVDIPVSECILNRGTIKDITPDSPISYRSSVFSISIPTEYLNEFSYIQNKIVNPDSVWVKGCNCNITTQFVTIYTSTETDVKTTNVFHDGSLTTVYRLYVWRPIKVSKYENTMSVICGFDLDRYDRDTRISLWSSYINGVTDATVNTVLSDIIGNDVCTEDSTITSCWCEGDRWYVSSRTGKVYAGNNWPRVSPGSAVRCGDLLFMGINRFDKSNTPSPAEVPCIEVPTGSGPIYAINSSIPAISSTIGTIPDMNNDKWSSDIRELQKSGEIGALSYDSYINPLKYALSNMFPDSLICFTIKGNIDDVSKSSAISRTIDLMYPTAIPIISRSVVSNTCVVTPNVYPGEVHIAIHTGEVHIDVYTEGIPIDTKLNEPSHRYI